MVAWAGYDHLQLARAISAYYVDVQERLGGRDDPRLVPLLACLIELLPWLKQWHNEVDPEFGVPMGDYFEGFLQEESRILASPTTRSRLGNRPSVPPAVPEPLAPVPVRGLAGVPKISIRRRNRAPAVRVSADDRNLARGSRRTNHRAADQQAVGADPDTSGLKRGERNYC